MDNGNTIDKRPNIADNKSLLFLLMYIYFFFTKIKLQLAIYSIMSC